MKRVKSTLFSTMSAALLVLGMSMFAAVNAQHDKHTTPPTGQTPPTAEAKACCGGTDGKPGCCTSEACAKAQASGHTSATASATTTGCRCCGDSCPLAKPATASADHASMAMGKTAATSGDSGCPCCGDSCQKPKPAEGGGTATAEGAACCSGNDSCCAKPATAPPAPPKGN